MVLNAFPVPGRGDTRGMVGGVGFDERTPPGSLSGGGGVTAARRESRAGNDRRLNQRCTPTPKPHDHPQGLARERSAALPGSDSNRNTAVL